MTRPRPLRALLLFPLLLVSFVGPLAAPAGAAPRPASVTTQNLPGCSLSVDQEDCDGRDPGGPVPVDESFFDHAPAQEVFGWAVWFREYASGPRPAILVPPGDTWLDVLETSLPELCATYQEWVDANLPTILGGFAGSFVFSGLCRLATATLGGVVDIAQAAYVPVRIVLDAAGAVVWWFVKLLVRTLFTTALAATAVGLELLGDAVAGVADGFASVATSVGRWFVFEEDVQAVAEEWNRTRAVSGGLTNNLGELASSITIVQGNAGCFTPILGSGPICVFEGINSISSSPLFVVLGVVWVGFWSVFTLVQGVAVLARVTDS